MTPSFGFYLIKVQLFVLHNDHTYNQFIAFCRDETTLLLPDVEKEDFQKLVKNLYGEAGSEKPSEELLRLLQIDRLPDESPIPNLAETSTTTLISKLFCY